mmetsp:Transcript_94967/g.245294  ORF Transcript_94967/g.245294 Transcript_94967/m.245294 type:complete len:541 (+) Transcript_94967:102-1724(+)
MAGDIAALRTLGLSLQTAGPGIVLSRQLPPSGAALSRSAPSAPSAPRAPKAPSAPSAQPNGEKPPKGDKKAEKAEKAAPPWRAPKGAKVAPAAADASLQRAPARPVEPGRVLKAGVPVAQQLEGEFFTCLSYNVLLPNSQDGWWIYKYYRELDSEAMAAWPARQALLREQLLAAAPDFICLQEVCELSFQDDFAFLAGAGYEALLHEKKGRMRPATFWRASRWELASAKHQDRVLVTALHRKGARPGASLFLANAHLSAGHNADRRLRQVQEALDAVAKECKKLGLDSLAVPAVFCGDLNSQGRTAVREFLLRGEVGPDFRESGDPTEKGQDDVQITTKVRKHGLALFADAAESTFGVDKTPPTILASNIDSKMLHDDGTPTKELLAAVGSAFDALCSAGQAQMSRQDVESWLMKVNRAVGRGSEYRAAMALFEKNGQEVLSREDFLSIYAAELAEGKYWGVEHDLKAMGGTGLAVPTEGPTELTFDHLFFTAGLLRLMGVQEPLTEQQRSRVYGEPWEVFPNVWHPSDHLPVLAAFALP